MDKRSIKAMVKKIEAQKKRIGIERDKLDDLILEGAEILEHCAEAETSLDTARDALSQLL